VSAFTGHRRANPGLGNKHAKAAALGKAGAVRAGTECVGVGAGDRTLTARCSFPPLAANNVQDAPAKAPAVANYSSSAAVFKALQEGAAEAQGAAKKREARTKVTKPAVALKL